MASTYSALKIELIATGEQSGTWGTTTNNNLGDAALGEAITGSADVTFASGDVTVTLTDSNASQTARNLRLNLIGTTGGARSLILGSGCQIEKLYLINNTCADAITVKNTSGTGIAVAAGKSMFVYNNGTNVVDAVTQFNGTISLTSGVTGTLPIANGGTGTTSTTFTNLTTNVTGTLPIANGGTGTTSTTFTNLTTNVTGTLPIANGGTGSTSTTFVNAATNITGTLPVANGGTGASTLTSANVILGAGTSAVTFVAPGSSGNVLTSNGSTWTSAAAAGGGDYVMQTFASPTTWTKPATLKAIKITVVGGGGGSGGSNRQPAGAAFSAGSGGGGGTAVLYLPAASIPGPQPVTVGTGGSAGGTTSNGGAGNSSSFGPLASATGGGAGTGTPSPASVPLTFGLGGAGSGGNLNITGGVGFQNTSNPGPVTTNDFLVGGPSFLAAGGTNAGELGSGGGKPLINNPPASTPGFAGGDGVIIVEEFY
jgi:hypothetical protein